ncbi:MAG: hypothetical protein WAN65_13865 [Candidatus Sulfotelmatobacter sp.]
MRDYAIFLKLLAERVYTAQLGNGARVLDPSDFRAWLVELSDIADRSSSVDEFFKRT